MSRDTDIKPTAKVLFRVPDDEGDADVETLWAVDLGEGLYKVCNLPYFAYGVSLHDVVYAPVNAEDGFPTFERVVSKSGNRTLRVILDPPVAKGNRSDALLAELVATGCDCEGANKGYVVINVPGSVHLPDIEELLTNSNPQWERSDPV
jgi:hypothetical protein